VPRPPGGAALRIVEPTSFAGKPLPERRWIVPDWVPQGFVTGLFGPGGVGKSLLTLQMQTALALAKPLFGIPVEMRRSIGVYCEDDVDELHRRQAAINREAFGCDFADLGEMLWLPRLGEDNLLMTFARSGKGEVTPFYGLLLEMACDEKAGFVVLDTLADMFGGSQNDAGQVRQFVQFGLGRLARTVGGVLVCAHPSRAGQNSGSGESGSVQWDAAFRSRLYLADPPKSDDDEIVDPNARLLARKKANYAARDEAIELFWRDGAFHTYGSARDDDRPDAESVFLALLDKMAAEGQMLSPNARAGNYAPKMFMARPERHGYRLPDFVRAMQSLMSKRDIRVEEQGRPSHRVSRIVRGEPPNWFDERPPEAFR
jgi:RecA-family ATPase